MNDNKAVPIAEKIPIRIADSLFEIPYPTWAGFPATMLVLSIISNGMTAADMMIMPIKRMDHWNPNGIPSLICS